jgi:hypothetical protein
MKTSRFAGSAVQVCLLLAGIIMLAAEGVMFLVGLVLGAGSVFWYVTKGRYLRGGVGSPESRAEARLAAVEAALERLDSIPDCPRSRARRQRLHSRRESLWQQLGQHSRSASR